MITEEETERKTEISNFLKKAKENLKSKQYTSLKEILDKANDDSAHNNFSIIHEIREVLGKKNPLAEMFNVILPEYYHAGHKMTYMEAMNFLHRIRQEASEIFPQFIELLKKYEERYIPIQELIQKAKIILFQHPEMFLEFNNFLLKNNEKNSVRDSENYSVSQTPNKDEAGHLQLVSKQPRENKNLEENYIEISSESDESFQFEPLKTSEKQFLLKNLKNTFKDSPEIYLQIMKLIDLYKLGVCNLSEFESAVEDHFNLIGMKKELYCLRQILATRNASRRMSSLLIQPLAELVCGPWEKQGSYTLLPEEFPPSIELSPELNWRWISVSSGSEGHAPKNIYEDSLNKCEDEQYQILLINILKEYYLHYY